MCAVLNTEGIVALDRLSHFVSCISHGARCENKNICVRTHSTPRHTLLIPTYQKSKKYIEETNISRYKKYNRNAKETRKKLL